MHENESSPLPHAANELLAQLWEWIDANPRPITRDHLRAVAWQVALSARETALLPEELIVAVRESWHEQEDSASNGEPTRSPWLLTEMISLCIEAFYRGHDVNRASPSGSPGIAESRVASERAS